MSAVVAAATAGAAATVLITSKDIKDGTIQAVDISAKAKSSLQGNRGPAGQRGARGPEGATGPVGLPGVQNLQEVVSPAVSVPPDEFGTATATCPSGQAAVSGGFLFLGIPSASVINVEGTAWVAIGFNDLSEPTDLIAVAYCTPAVTVTIAPPIRKALRARASQPHRSAR